MQSAYRLIIPQAWAMGSGFSAQHEEPSEAEWGQAFILLNFDINFSVLVWSIIRLKTWKWIDISSVNYDNWQLEFSFFVIF